MILPNEHKKIKKIRIENEKIYSRNHNMFMKFNYHNHYVFQLSKLLNYRFKNKYDTFEQYVFFPEKNYSSVPIQKNNSNEIETINVNVRFNKFPIIDKIYDNKIFLIRATKKFKKDFSNVTLTCSKNFQQFPVWTNKEIKLLHQCFGEMNINII